MPRKTSHLQIRVTPEQKRTMKRLAHDAAMDMSTWVLARVLPDGARRFQDLTANLATADQRRFALAELADFVRPLAAGSFLRAVAEAPRARLDANTLNHVAAAIDLAARRRGVAPPPWTRDVTIPAMPRFGSELTSVRLHLLTRSPVALRRRNLFMDASVDERV
jgi:hypothetical protein